MNFREISNKFDISINALMQLRVYWGRYRDLEIYRIRDGELKRFKIRLDFKEYTGAII